MSEYAELLERLRRDQDIPWTMRPLRLEAAAADAAAAYAAADAADAAAKHQCYERMADKLLALMAECDGEPLRVAMGMVA